MYFSSIVGLFYFGRMKKEKKILAFSDFHGHSSFLRGRYLKKNYFDKSKFAYFREGKGTGYIYRQKR